ncbi:hypothetical protein [Bacillus tuaregi]|uniref:hypothetical protein n=1 Tax=Bacillus tuaregi TaxID=1816695 RepID=UPI0008F8AB60|nr:hypothetical protein [Bacillus tuaregi]
MDTKNIHSGDKKSKENIEVWEDLVSIKDLVRALLIMSLTTMGAYFLAPNDPPKPLFFGLVGALIGFILTSFIIKPKRILQEVESEE